jgi:hypothetical protein
MSGPGDLPAVDGWVEIPAAAAQGWNGPLLETAGSLHQFPYWLEPLRPFRFGPRYFVYGEGGRALAFIGALEVGVPGMRGALLRRAPVLLPGCDVLPSAALQDFVRLGRRLGWVFLRCTHHDRVIVDEWAALGEGRRVDAFPFYSDPHEELLVPQAGDDGAVLKSFQSVARRNIRAAEKVGFRIEASDGTQLLADAWPLFETVTERKGFSLRPLESFQSTIRLGSAVHGTRTYVAFLDDRPVQAILIARDGAVAHYLIGALDVEALEGRPSPSALLHWTAMREFARDHGSSHYNLGTRSGVVWSFKQKFRPHVRSCPAPVTVVLRPARFRIWMTFGLGLATRAWPKARAVVLRRSR